MVRYCSQCGKQMDDSSAFCNNCGKPVDVRPGYTYDYNKGGYDKYRVKKIGTILLIIFVIIALFIIIYAFLNVNGYLSPMGGLSGTWSGSGTFTNGGINCGNPACRYVGSSNPPSVVLELQQNENMVFGTVTINIPDSDVVTLVPGQGCSGFYNSVSDINNGILSGNRLTFMDDGGNIWTLNFTNNLCKGTVGSNAIGCTGLAGDVSLSK